MKKFWKQVSTARTDGGWQVTLDGRGIRTQGGDKQIVPTQQASELLAAEWRVQGEEVDTRGFVFRDFADFAIDIVRPDPSATIAKLLTFADTDTLCYRAAPEEPLFRRQQDVWEPLVQSCEKRHAISIERASGIIHRPHSEATTAALRERLEGEDAFTLAALVTLASLSASLIVALAVLDEDIPAADLFSASNAEEDWQAELWGWDLEAENARKLKLEAFEKAAEFASAVRA